MALLLRPGDPLPALTLATGKLDLNQHAGHFWGIAAGARLAVDALDAGDLPVVRVHEPEAAQRLGADFDARAPQPLVVLLDPAGTVVQSWADAPLADLWALARQRADGLARK